MGEFKKRVMAGLAASALGLLGSCGGADQQALAGRPNILLISIDSLRADHLGAYGYPRATSPAIDALAAEGVRFEHVMSSSSWTLPSHATLFTGLPMAAHGCSSKHPRLTPAARTLAEQLGDAGYRTAGFWSGPYLHPVFGLDQGFDDYVSCANFGYYKDKQAGGQGRANTQSHRDVTNPKLTESVLQWMRDWKAESSSAPFFLFVHMWDVHYDFFPPAPYDTLFDPDYQGPMDGTRMRQVPGKLLAAADMQHSRALYDGEIAWTDQHVGQILGELEALGWKENTVVVVTADHGEEFWERGEFGHRKTLFEESVRVPLVLRLPGGAHAGAVVPDPVGLLDIAPTLLALAHRAHITNPDLLPGQSLLPLIEESKTSKPRTRFAELWRPQAGASRVMLREGDWKFLFDSESDVMLGAWKLSQDAGELHNRLDAAGDLPASLRDAAQAEYQALRKLERSDPLGARSTGPANELPENVANELDGLGYTGQEDAEEH